MFCRYFRAQILKEKTWLLTGLLKNEENIAFERALDPKSGLFEFFVPESQVAKFMQFMACASKLGLIIGEVQEGPNRLQQEAQK